MTGDDQTRFRRNEWDLTTGRHRVLEPGDGGRWLASQPMPEGRSGASLPRQPFGWTTARTFRLGSMNQAAHEWPMSAIPSVVTGSGASYSSMRTPRARSSSTAARMSGTRHAIWVWRVGGPDGAERDGQLGPAAAAEDDPVAFVLAHDLEPERVAVEGRRGVEVRRQQDREHRIVAEHRALLKQVTPRRIAQDPTDVEREVATARRPGRVWRGFVQRLDKAPRRSHHPTLSSLLPKLSLGKGRRLRLEECPPG